MNKSMATTLISMILILMIITISIILKFSSSIIDNIAGNVTKNTIDKNILNTTSPDYNYTPNNHVAYTNTTSENNTNENTSSHNEVAYTNSIQNVISVENTITTHNNTTSNSTVDYRNTVTPPPAENEIKGRFANTGVVPGLHSGIQQAVITTDDVYELFLNQYSISKYIPGIDNYMSEQFFRKNNLGIIYIPLEEGQNFEIEKQGESNGTIYINLKLNPSYSDNEKTNGMLVLVELEKTTTKLQVTS